MWPYFLLNARELIWAYVYSTFYEGFASRMHVSCVISFFFGVSLANKENMY